MIFVLSFCGCVTMKLNITTSTLHSTIAISPQWCFIQLLFLFLLYLLRLHAAATTGPPCIQVLDSPPLASTADGDSYLLPLFAPSLPAPYTALLTRLASSFSCPSQTPWRTPVVKRSIAPDSKPVAGIRLVGFRCDLTYKVQRGSFYHRIGNKDCSNHSAKQVKPTTAFVAEICEPTVLPFFCASTAIARTHSSRTSVP